jgi:hypothetical protein
MARDRASIRLDMWADEDWRRLSAPAQHLYMLLLSHPTLSYAGVADWRPGRLSQLSGGNTIAGVNAAGDELERAGFILRDPITEEVLIRSFIKHDGLMKQPKLVVSMTIAFAAIASTKIREVVAHEVQKLRDRDNGFRWEVPQVQTVLAAKGSPITTFTPALTPGFTPNPGHTQALPTATETATTTEASLLTPGDDEEAGRRKEVRLPKDWVPTAAHYDRAKKLGVDISRQVEAFRLHAETHDRHAAQWNSAFTTWLNKSKPVGANGRPAPVDWMNR